jgi:hypothetical protein
MAYLISVDCEKHEEGDPPYVSENMSTILRVVGSMTASALPGSSRRWSDRSFVLAFWI